MRSFTLLALTALLGCSGSDDTDPDTDTDTDTDSDTDTDTDTDSDTDAEPDPDFTANGPGAGYQWLLAPAPTDAPFTKCGVGSQNSFNFYADTWQVQSPSTSLMQFALALQATPGGTMGCDYELDGSFTCNTISTTTNLNNLPPPYNMDAIVTMTTTASGRFRERTDVDPGTEAPHTFARRWAADLDLTFGATCSGAACASAASGMGAAGYPCESKFTGLQSVNYSDPTLSDPI